MHVELGRTGLGVQLLGEFGPCEEMPLGEGELRFHVHWRHCVVRRGHHEPVGLQKKEEEFGFFMSRNCWVAGLCHDTRRNRKGISFKTEKLLESEAHLYLLAWWFGEASAGARFGYC